MLKFTKIISPNGSNSLVRRYINRFYFRFLAGAGGNKSCSLAIFVCDIKTAMDQNMRETVIPTLVTAIETVMNPDVTHAERLEAHKVCRSLIKCNIIWLSFAVHFADFIGRFVLKI